MSGTAWFATLVTLVACGCLLVGTASDSWSVYKDTYTDPVFGTTETKSRISYYWSCSTLDQSAADIHDNQCVTYQMCKAFDKNGDRDSNYDIKNSNSNSPKPRDRYCDKYRVGQAFSIISVILAFFGACSAFAFAWRTVNHGASSAAGFAFWAGLVALIPFAIWGDWMENNSNFDNYKYGYGFIIYTIGWILCFVASGISWTVKQGFKA